MAKAESWDVVVIGSGPAGQNAALQAARSGRRVALVERERGVGGACVHSGTIPSKTLRETAVYLAGFRRRTRHVIDVEIPPHLQLASLMNRMERVVEAHVHFQGKQLEREGITPVHGRARFLSDREIEVESVRGARRRLRAELIVIATGSRPRTPPDVPVDHEHVLDSDSILSMAYLPETLTVLGAGVIACEYASIFAALGVQVTMIDKNPRPLGFLDEEMVQRFLADFESHPGCVFVGDAAVEEVAWDGVSKVVTRLDNGWENRSDKMLCALGRVANVEGLDIEAAGLTLTQRGQIQVDSQCRTAVPHIYAVGDVIGPPSLASTSMEQGRRAMRSALGVPLGIEPGNIPMGIYTIPEISSVGLDEATARSRFGGCLVGRARFAELARGQIACATDGLLKLVADPQGKHVLGAQIVGEGATELVQLAQLAIRNGEAPDVFVECIFNFPTMAEAFRVAALDLIQKREAVTPTASC